MKALVADDDLTSRAMVRVVLETLGYEVRTANDGAEAWAIMRAQNPPRLVILDWMMPHLDGDDVCRKIRSLENNRPPYIIMLTSLGDSRHLVAGLEAGADDYVGKPFDAEVLRARVGVGRRILDLQERLAVAATTDALTGLLNRGAGLDALGRELSRASRENRPVGIGLLDIDHFKQVNDVHGHLVGDDVLRELSARLRQLLRPYDQLCRYGGEEFLLIAPGNGDEIAPWERVRQAVASRPFHTRGGQLEVTVSIGHTSGQGNHCPDDLIAAADLALYQAKAGGRNRIAHEPAAAPRVPEPQRRQPQRSRASPSTHPSTHPTPRGVPRRGRSAQRRNP